ncbi:tyrosine-type recombinase/integrase [Haloarculaceae archaeon H-GB1-1]|nr:tyrosine-type recombinase/integrase [Haloarculaceae archaeon H-GB1-1]
MTEPRTQIENYRDRIRESDEITKDDADVLIEFSDQMDLLKSEYSDLRHRDLLGHCTRIAENVGGLADALEDHDAAEEIVRWINRTHENEWTNADYRAALRVFGGRTTDGDVEDKPDSIEWVPSGTSNSHDPRPNPANMLTWENDVKPMIDDTRNARDAALIAVAFDSGARSGELEDLRVGDVADHDHGLQIFVDGKKGQRSVTLIPAVPFLNRWISDHPDSDDPDAPLWSKLSKPDEISYRQFNNAFKDAAKRAGVDKPVTPTNFRKSNASWLARKGMPQAFIEDRQGRKRGSDVTAHYVAKFGGEADTTYAKLHGKDVEEDDPDPIGPVDCPRCGKETPRDEDACVWCRQPLEYDTVEARKQEDREVRSAVLRMAKENPDLLDNIEQAREFMDLFEDDPELFADAREFADALSDG